MLTNPSIRCAQCASDELEAALDQYTEEASPDVSSLTCTQCGFSWKACETPMCAGPNYAEAYDAPDVPDLVDEELTLILLTEDLKTCSIEALAGRGPAVDGRGRRMVLLREAARLDRAAREIELGYFAQRYTDGDVNEASTEAVRAASDLLDFDLAHGQAFVEGPAGASSPAWDGFGGTRSYVRQEYLAWRAAGSEAADRAGMLPHRGVGGELFDGEGRPL